MGEKGFEGKEDDHIDNGVSAERLDPRKKSISVHHHETSTIQKEDKEENREREKKNVGGSCLVEKRRDRKRCSGHRGAWGEPVCAARLHQGEKTVASSKEEGSKKGEKKKKRSQRTLYPFYMH